MQIIFEHMNPIVEYICRKSRYTSFVGQDSLKLRKPGEIIRLKNMFKSKKWLKNRRGLKIEENAILAKLFNSGHIVNLKKIVISFNYS